MSNRFEFENHFAKTKPLGNPQFANVQSKKRKLHNLELHSDLRLTLISAKKTVKENVFVDDKSFENALYYKKFKKFMNWLLKKKNEKVLSEFAKVYFVGKKDKPSKEGLFSLYFVEQMVQKVIRLQDKGLTYIQAIKTIEANKLSK